VIGDGLGMLKSSTILQVSGDAGGSKRVAAGGIGEGGHLSSPLDHVEDVEPRHCLVRKPVAFVHAAEKPLLGVASDASSPDIGIQVALKAQMAGHFVPFTPFLMQPQL